MATKLHVICAWCHRVLQVGTTQHPNNTSHGICSTCEREWTKEAA